MDAPKLYTLPETAKILAISLRTLRRLIDRGEVNTVHIGRSVRVNARELERLCRDGCATL